MINILLMVMVIIWLMMVNYDILWLVVDLL